MARQMDVQYINYYCAGSAALKVAPAIPLNTLELPQKKRAKKVVVRVDPIACAGINIDDLMYGAQHAMKAFEKFDLN